MTVQHEEPEPEQTPSVTITQEYSTEVNTLAEAWRFVFDRIDDLGDDPAIAIEPRWAADWSDVDDEDDLTDDEYEFPVVRTFAVTLKGIFEEEDS